MAPKPKNPLEELLKMKKFPPLPKGLRSAAVTAWHEGASECFFKLQDPDLERFQQVYTRMVELKVGSRPTSCIDC